MGPTPRIIFCISLNWRSRLLTSVVEVPLPWAIRSRREPSSTVGSARSRGVIEQMIASTLSTSRSSTLASRISFGRPGIIARRPESGPIFLI